MKFCFRQRKFKPARRRSITRQFLNLETLELRLAPVAGCDTSNWDQQHSFPGEEQIIYLDFLGDDPRGTVDEEFNSDATAGVGSSAGEADLVCEIWAWVAEDWRPFNVDVTTEAPAGSDPFTDVGGGDTNWGARVMIGGTSSPGTRPCGAGSYGCGSVGNYRTGDPNGPMVNVYDNGTGANGQIVSIGVSHETGHTFGLGHDGTCGGDMICGNGDDSGYIFGYPVGTIGDWTAIMGGAASWLNLSQWSNGSYFNANNPEDDLDIIANDGWHGLGYRTDDHGNSDATSTAVTVVSSASVTGSGIIEQTSDVDYFKFSVTGAGMITLNIDPAPDGPNLDIRADLYDSSLTLVATSDDPNTLSASISQLLATGVYYLKIDGVGKTDAYADPPTGFTDYGSLGYFSLSGAAGGGIVFKNDLDPDLTIADATQVETNAGTTTFTFTVTLSAASPQTVYVDWATSLGTATTGSDYLSATGTLTFLPGDTSEDITVTVYGDTTYESDETFFVDLSTPVNAGILDFQATGTISNDDALPSASIDSVSDTEGNAGTKTLIFTITLSNPSYQNVVVNYATANGTAFTSDSDYVGISGSAVTFTPGQTSKTVSVTIVGDTKYETDETFLVNLTGVTNGTVGGSPGIGTITNDDAVPIVSIVASANTTEGNSGTKNLSFSVNLDRASYQTIVVQYDTTDGTATIADGDYVAASGLFVTFNPGETNKTINITLNGDTKYEVNETFPVTLSNPTNVVLGASVTSVGTITNDDTAPSVTVTGGSVTEGNAGTTPITFTVTLSAVSGVTATVNYATSNNTAVTPADYAGVTGSLTFNPGETVKTVDVNVVGELLFELNETFNFTLSVPSGVTIAVSTAVGTITNDDTAPNLTISGPVATAEGNSGATGLVFTVALSAVSGTTTSVNYATADATATLADNDYFSTSGTLIFAAGETSKPITVNARGDTKFEVDEDVTVNLSGPSNATIAVGSASALITNDDTIPAISIANASTTEGNSGTKVLSFNLSLSNASYQTITVTYTTSDGTATIADGDYVAVGAGVVTFNPGETSKTAAVTINGNTVYELDETITVTLSLPTNATLGVPAGTGTITNDDAPPVLSIASNSLVEGNGGVSNIALTATLSTVSNVDAVVNYATSDGAATVADGDYVSTSGTLTFLAGETSKTISVPINGDGFYELNEAFNVNLSGATNASIGVSTNTGIITNDDPPPVLSVADVTVDEGNSGTTGLTLSVTLIPISGTIAIVNYTTTDGTATVLDSDYVDATGTLTFLAGETSKTITINAIGDTKFEQDDTFTVTLSNPNGANLGSSIGTGTIINDDPIPSMSIADASVLEEDEFTKKLFFTASLSNSSYLTIDANYATTDDTATLADGDYAPANNTVVFFPGETSKTFSVTINSDIRYETDETFSVNLSAPLNATLGDANAIGTILNDDTPPVLSIANSSATEGNLGSKIFLFTVTQTPASGATTIVTFGTADASATLADNDYLNATGSLTFAPGDILKTLSVSITGDSLFETDETFSVNLSAPLNAALGVSSATGTITNDDAPPIVSLGNATLTEGNSGTTPLLLSINLSNASTQAVTVAYATADITATAGTDYTAASGVVTFLAGETSKSIAVSVAGETLFELDETFSVTLSLPTNATLGVSTGTGTIANDDSIPVLSIANVSAAEGNAGSTAFVFNLTLSAASGATTTVAYATADGTATVADADYPSTSGTLTFNPGETLKTITVNVAGDTQFEPDETFSLNLSAPLNATLGVSSATGTITNDDSQSAISIAAAAVVEGNSGTAALAFNLSLSNPSSQTITVAYATGDATATTADGDYTPASGTITFNPGETLKTITVNAAGDIQFEADETFTVNLSAPANATLATPAAIGTITNDDAQPAISVTDLAVIEGNSGSTLLVFNLSLSNPSFQTITVSYATADGTAMVSGGDYLATSGIATFLPGVTLQTIIVQAYGDIAFEADETFSFNLSAPANATLATPTATGTITNDDAFPSISIGDVSITEGNSGTSNLVFTLTLGSTSASTITVDYATSNSTAMAPSDYTAASGTITFAPGVSTQPITITINGDATPETVETFLINLANALNATIADTQAIGTIINDDTIVTISANDPNASESGDPGQFTVSLPVAASFGLTIFYTVSGSATAGSDYSALSGSVFISGGNASAVINLNPLNDPNTEGTETVIVTLTADTAYLIGIPGNATINIADDEPEVSIQANDPVLSESGDPGQFILTRTGSTTADLTVFYTLSGSATTGSDYSALSGSVVITAGNATATIDVTPLNDASTEPNETIIITLTPNASYTVVTPDAATATITDNEPEISISATDPNAAEPADPGSFTISRTGNTTTALVVNLLVSGTASNGVDFTTLTTSATIAAGQSSVTLTVAPIDDAVDETDEIVILTLQPNAAYTLTSSTIASVTLADNDTAGVTVTPNTGLFTTETGDTAVFTVVLTSQPSGNVSINLSSSDLTEAAVSPATLLFTSANWNIAQTITLTGVDDVADDGDIALIILTSSATSGDPLYNGLAVADVALTNLDDENGLFGNAGRADFNSDGVADFAQINPGAGSISVFLRQRDGTFRQRQLLTLPTPVQTIGNADFNADGRMDLIISYVATDDLTLFLGSGKGKFKRASDHGPLGPSWAAATDFNADAIADVAIANTKIDATSIFLGIGNGFFAPRADIFDTEIGSNPRALVPGDYDGDGRTDLAVLNTKSKLPLVVGSSLRVLLGDGNGNLNLSFYTAVVATGMAPGDVNGDGKTDLALFNANDHTTAILLSNGNAFVSPVSSPAGLSPVEVALADFNGDANLDLVVANSGSNNIFVRLGNGDGSFGAATTHATAISPIGLALGDFTGDGNLDVLIADKSDTIRTLAGNGSGNFLLL